MLVTELTSQSPIAPNSDMETLSRPLYCPAQNENGGDLTRMSAYVRNDAGSTLIGQPPLTAGAWDSTQNIMMFRDTGEAVSSRLFGGAETSSAYSRSGTLTMNRFSLGAILRNSPSNYAQGSLNEVIICSNLSDADREIMEGYLAHKWGLTDNLDLEHPYRSEAPPGFIAVSLDGTVTEDDGDDLTTTWIVSSTEPAGLEEFVRFDDAGAIDTTARFSSTGVYTLRLVADDGFGPVFDEVVITVNDPLPTAYATWATAKGLADPNPAGNGDGDPYSNFFEYAFGTDPTVADAGPLATDGSTLGGPTTKKDVGGDMEFHFVRRKDGSLLYQPKFSANLVNFSNSLFVPEHVADSDLDPATYEVVKVPYTEGMNFGQLEVEFAP